MFVEDGGKFSVVAYYFARDWQAANGVPVGIVNATWGGTPVASWLSAANLASDPAFYPTLTLWAQTVAENPKASAAYGTALAGWEGTDVATAA